MKPFSILIPLAALTLSGVADARPRTTATRFFLAQDVQRGPVTSASTDGGLEAQIYRDAVAAELGRQGFAQSSDTARYVYSIEYSRDMQPSTRRKPSFSIGLGGSSGGGYYGGSSVGGGLGIGFGGGRGQSVFTRLSVQLRERAGSTVWEGRAETEDKPTTSQREIADRLAYALFRDFPGVNGRTITVK